MHPPPCPKSNLLVLPLPSHMGVKTTVGANTIVLLRELQWLSAARGGLICPTPSFASLPLVRSGPARGAGKTVRERTGETQSAHKGRHHSARPTQRSPTGADRLPHHTRRTEEREKRHFTDYKLRWAMCGPPPTASQHLPWGLRGHLPAHVSSSHALEAEPSGGLQRMEVAVAARLLARFDQAAYLRQPVSQPVISKVKRIE